MAQPRQGKDAITLLKEDHKKVKGLLSQLEKTTERGAGRRLELLGRIETEIKAHTTIEEEIFYPAYRDAVRKKGDRELYQEALEEHHVVDLILPEIKRTDPTGEIFGAKAKVLKELIQHHADEEEEAMFPKARQVIGAAEMRDLGSRMEDRKRTLKAKGKRKKKAKAKGVSSGGRRPAARAARPSPTRRTRRRPAPLPAGSASAPRPRRGPGR